MLDTYSVNGKRILKPDLMLKARAYNDIWENIEETVWVRLLVSTWQCSCVQSQGSKEIVFQVWCGRTWLSSTEPWPQPHPTPLCGARMSTASQTLSPVSRARPHKCTWWRTGTNSSSWVPECSCGLMVFCLTSLLDSLHALGHAEDFGPSSS